MFNINYNYSKLMKFINLLERTRTLNNKFKVFLILFEEV